MTAAFLTRPAEGRVEVRPAGSAPSDSVSPAAVEAMKEAGVDRSARVPSGVPPPASDGSPTEQSPPDAVRRRAERHHPRPPRP
ncbi:hypothetical protein ACFVZ6_22805, partial [Streptomyces sp. NPDC059597]